MVRQRIVSTDNWIRSIIRIGLKYEKIVLSLVNRNYVSGTCKIISKFGYGCIEKWDVPVLVDYQNKR